MTSVSNKQHSAKIGGWIHYLFKQHERWENVEKNVEKSWKNNKGAQANKTLRQR